MAQPVGAGQEEGGGEGGEGGGHELGWPTVLPGWAALGEG